MAELLVRIKALYDAAPKTQTPQGLPPLARILYRQYRDKCHQFYITYGTYVDLPAQGNVQEIQLPPHTELDNSPWD